jgi:outer membrane protein assembly factor BamD
MRKITLIALSLLLVFAASCAKKKVAPAPTGAYDLEATFRQANALVDKKQYAAARRDFELIKGRDSEMKYAPLAHLRIADTYILEKEYDPAIVEYRKFIEFYPDHKYASYAQYKIGMIYFDQIEDAERGQDAARRALEEFEKLDGLYPRNPYRETLVYYIEKCRDIISEHTFLVGNFYFKKKAYEAAVDRYLEVLDEFPDFKKKEEAYYQLALSLARMGEDERARRYLIRLKTEYPGSKLAEKAEKEIAKYAGKKG